MTDEPEPGTATIGTAISTAWNATIGGIQSMVTSLGAALGSRVAAALVVGFWFGMALYAYYDEVIYKWRENHNFVDNHRREVRSSPLVCTDNSQIVMNNTEHHIDRLRADMVGLMGSINRSLSEIRSGQAAAQQIQDFTTTTTTTKKK